MSQNRITYTTVAETAGRQTPRNEFGEVFAKTGLEVAKAGAGLVGAVGSIATGSPVVSAAVSSLQTFLAKAASGTQQSTTGLPQGGTLGGGGTTGGTGIGGEAAELEAANRAMHLDGLRLNTMYLNMQREMQRESREFTALSNIMKVRHDTAKSAINNVR